MNYAIPIVQIISTKWTIQVFRIFVKWIAATRACCAQPASLCLWMHILHACPGIITISACVLRIRDYYFSGELASFPLPRPYIEKKIDKMDKINQLIYNPRERENRDRLFRGRCSRKFFFWKFLLWEEKRREVCKRFVGNIVIYTRLLLYTMRLCCNRGARESPTRFSKKQKQEGKKKYRRRLSLHARWTGGTFRLEDFSFSIPRHARFFKFSIFEILDKISGKIVVIFFFLFIREIISKKRCTSSIVKIRHTRIKIVWYAYQND